MNNWFTALLILAALGGGAFIISQQSNSNPQTQQTTEPAAMKRLTEESQTTQASNYTGSVLAGTTTPYLEFNKADYEKALKEEQVIVLNFYADWCPICRAEEPDVKAAFDSLQNDIVIGFQVNFKDNQTDADEKALAQEFGVPYQHTKVILKDGKQVLKETAQWDKQQFVDAIHTAIR